MKLIYTIGASIYVNGADIGFLTVQPAKVRAVCLGLKDEYSTSYIFGLNSVETIILHSMYSYATGRIR